MALIGKRKVNGVDAVERTQCRVKILGGGCARCGALEKSTLEALALLGMDTHVEHVTDYSAIASYGVMSTPALVMDGKVLCSGRVPGRDEIAEMIKKAGVS